MKTIYEEEKRIILKRIDEKKLVDIKYPNIKNTIDISKDPLLVKISNLFSLSFFEIFFSTELTEFLLGKTFLLTLNLLDGTCNTFYKKSNVIVEIIFSCSNFLVSIISPVTSIISRILFSFW